MSNIKLNKKILLLVIVISIMIINFIYETNVISNLSKYLTDLNYRKGIMLSNNNFNFIYCFFKLLGNTLYNFDWNFDYILIWSTNIFQTMLPFFAVFGSVYYLKIEKQSNIKNIFSESFKLSSIIFLAYIIFYLFILIICKGNYDSYITRELFNDILGKSFYYDHIYIYYFFDGLIRFFMVPFIYISSGIMLGLSIKNKKWLYFYIIITYFGLAIISLALVRIINVNFIYLNPMSIMISGSYYNVSTILLILVNLIPIIFSFYIFIKRGNKYEK